MKTILYRELTNKNEYLLNNIDVEDYPTAVELTHNVEFKHLPISVMTYRVHNKSYSNSSDFNNRKEFTKRQLDMSLYFSNKYSFSEAWITEREIFYYLSLFYIATDYGNEKQVNECLEELRSRNYKLTFPQKVKLITYKYYIVNNLAIKLKNLFS